MTSEKFHPFRRKEKTNYKRRLALLKSGLPRFVVRFSLKNIVAQYVTYEPTGDKVIVAVSTKELEKMGWKASRSNTPAAYLVGYLLSKKSQKLSVPVPQAILDIGKVRSTAQSRLYAAVKGAIAGGCEIFVDEEILPEDSRVEGTHISAYGKTLAKENPEAYKKQFSGYIAKGITPETIEAQVKSVKSAIDSAYK